MEDRLTFHLSEYDKVDSTNTMIKQAIEQGAPEGTAVCARVQTGGYGRQGRAWASPEGGMYVSVLLRPKVPAAQLPTLSLVVGLAVRRALMALYSGDLRDGDRGSNVRPHASNDLDAGVPDIRVKWPNDVVLGRPQPPARSFAKLCGISLEQHVGALCVGIGVNVLRKAGTVPVGGKNTAAYVHDMCPTPATPSIEQVRDAVLAQLSTMYPVWLRDSFAAFVSEYDGASALQGMPVSVQRADGTTIAQGIARNVDDNGHLLVESTDGTVHIATGEIHLTLSA